MVDFPADQVGADVVALKHEQSPHCLRCERPTRRATSILDIRKDRPITIFRCDTCGEEIWDDHLA